LSRFVDSDGNVGRYISPKLIAEYEDSPTKTYLYLTGKGETENADSGRVEEGLRGGRSGVLGNTNEDNRRNQTQVSDESLLSGYDWYSNDVEYGQKPRLVETSERVSAPKSSLGNANDGSKTEPSKKDVSADIEAEDELGDISDLPFAFGEDEDATSAVPNTDEGEQVENAELMGKSQAKKDFGFAYDSIQESSKKLKASNCSQKTSVLRRR